MIDEAIRETWVWERVCLGFTITFGILGVVLLVIGAIRGDAGITGPGVGAAVLLAPTLWAAVRIRERNIRVRLLEIPLQKAKTAKEMAEIIDAVFLRRTGEKQTNAAS